MSDWKHSGSLDIFEKIGKPDSPSWVWIILILIAVVVVLS